MIIRHLTLVRIFKNKLLDTTKKTGKRTLTRLVMEKYSCFLARTVFSKRIEVLISSQWRPNDLFTYKTVSVNTIEGQSIVINVLQLLRTSSFYIQIESIRYLFLIIKSSAIRNLLSSKKSKVLYFIVFCLSFMVVFIYWFT